MVIGLRHQFKTPIYARHVGSVAAHRRFAATFASARPPCRLSDRHIFSDRIFAVIKIPLQQLID